MNFSDSKNKPLKKAKYIPDIIKCYDTFISNDGKLTIKDYFYVHELISKSFHSNKYSNLLKNVNRTLSRKIKLPLELNDFLNYIYKLPIHSKNITLANELYNHFKTHKNEFYRRIVKSYYSFILCVVGKSTTPNKGGYHFNFYEEYNELKNHITHKKEDKMLLNLFKIVNVFYDCFGNENECADHIYNEIKTVPNKFEIVTEDYVTEDEIKYHLHWLTHQQQNEFYNDLLEMTPCTLIKNDNYYNEIANYLIRKYIKYNPHLYLINHIEQPATIELLENINDFISREADDTGLEYNKCHVGIDEPLSKEKLGRILDGLVSKFDYTKKYTDDDINIEDDNPEYLDIYNTLFFE